MANKPLENGSLDGLNGIYAICNAISIPAGLTVEKQLKLFTELVDYLEGKKALRTAIIDGLSKTKVNELIGTSKKYLQTIKLELKSKMIAENAGNINGIWTAMNDFLNDKETKEKRIILVAIGNKREDWTVIEKISDRRVNLFGAKGLKHIDRADMNSSETNPNLYTIFKETVWGLSISPAK